MHRFQLPIFCTFFLKKKKRLETWHRNIAHCLNVNAPFTCYQYVLKKFTAMNSINKCTTLTLHAFICFLNFKQGISSEFRNGKRLKNIYALKLGWVGSADNNNLNNHGIMWLSLCAFVDERCFIKNIWTSQKDCQHAPDVSAPTGSEFFLESV